jgi:hypothetical protein
MTSKTDWHKRYRELLMSEGGMTKQQAFDYLIQNKAFFDYGYSPEWYVKEEMACLDNYAEYKVCHKFDGTVVRKESHGKKKTT